MGRAQINSIGVLSLGQIEAVTAKPGQTFTLRLPLHLREGFHVNSNMPADSFLIPLKLTWNPGVLQVENIEYPKPQMEKFAFSPNPVSIFSGTFEILTKFKAPANAPKGAAPLTGKLRYQACNNKECLAPKTLDIQAQVDLQ